MSPSGWSERGNPTTQVFGKSLSLPTKPFGRWSQVLDDATVALATMPALLVHRADVVRVEGDSYPAKASRLRLTSAARAWPVGNGITKNGRPRWPRGLATAKARTGVRTFSMKGGSRSAAEP